MSVETPATQARCFRCEKPVAADDVQSGRAYLRDGYYVCPECVEQIRKGSGSRELETLKSQLAAMTAELRNISQHLHYEDFSWMFVVGGVFQVLTFYILYRAYQTQEPTPTLLWAVVLQLMTVTAFVVGKLR